MQIMGPAKEGYRPRIVDDEIRDKLRISSVVCVEGPKYCGKTWTSTIHSMSMCALDDPANNYLNLRMARSNVLYAITGDTPHLVDEWQLVPSVWDAVRRKADETGVKGMYILSGSATPSMEQMPIHSGFGRITKVRMRTMSLLESSDSDGSASLSGLFRGELGLCTPRNTSFEDLAKLILRGGWPGNLSLSTEDAIRVVADYPEHICYNDVPKVDPNKNPLRMMMLLRSLARNECTLASASTLAKDIRQFDDEVIKDTTVQEYISVLDRMFLIENQPAYNPNLRSSIRVGKTPKRHLTDPALAAAAMGLTLDLLLGDPNTMGLLFESMCERDLQIYASAIGGKLFHYRDAKGREIDAIVELADGRWGAFEIKLTTERIDEAAANLLRISSMIADDPNGKCPEFLCVICGTESAAYRRDDGVYVVPIRSLGP